MFKSKFIIIFSLIINICFIAKSNAESLLKWDEFHVALGGQAESQIYKRGIITYGGSQALPIYAITLFNPDLILAGSALYYKRQFFNKNLFIRTRLNFDSTNDSPLYLTSEKKDDRIRRESTAEFDLFLEYLFPNESFLRLNVSQDLIAHKGHYLELRGRLALFDWLKNPGEKALIQPGLFFAAGYGDSKHNEYFYGAGANTSSFNNIEYGLSVTSPKVIDLFWPTFTISRFNLLGENNKNGSYVQEKNGWAVQALFAFKVW